MIKDLMQRAGAGLAAVVLAAFAGGIALVALSYALFAVLERVVSAAGAAAITALVFAGVTAAIAMLASRVTPRKHEIVAARPRLNPDAVRLATEAGVAILGIAGDMALSRRLKHEEKAQGRSRRKR